MASVYHRQIFATVPEELAQDAKLTSLMNDIGQWKDIPMNSRYEIQRPVSRGKIFEVLLNNEDSNKYLLRNIKTGMYDTPANGHYIFVNRSDAPGRLYAMRQHSSEVGHTSLAQKGGGPLPVRYAGVMTFRDGALIRWTNNSGHYQPRSNLAHSNLIPWVRRLLPAKRFESFNM